MTPTANETGKAFLELVPETAESGGGGLAGLRLGEPAPDKLFAESAMMQGKFGHMITAGDLP
ncbi:MAG: hypothetical protein ACRYF2_11040 [Janthinobacterium lividum]